MEAKTIDQQPNGIIVKHREMLVSERTQAINAPRGHATVFGVVATANQVSAATLLITT